MMRNAVVSQETENEPVPGMCYVPLQTLGKTYEPMRALAAGTVFPELDKPFTGKCTMGGRRR